MSISLHVVLSGLHDVAILNDVGDVEYRREIKVIIASLKSESMCSLIDRIPVSRRLIWLSFENAC